MKKLLSWILVLALCLSLFPGAALAEDAEEPAGEIAPVEEPVPSLEDDDGELGTPAPAEEDEAGALAGDGVIDVPGDDPAALPTAPAADEIQADSGTCGDNLTWTLDDDGLLIISGEGEMTNWMWNKVAPWFQQRPSIREIRIEDGVTSVGSYAFYGCSNLEKLTLAEGITDIGEFAFYECGALTKLRLPEALCSIGAYAFSACDSLSSVTIPRNVTNIMVGAFTGDDSLTEILVEEGNPAYASRDGVLFNASGTALVLYPCGRTGAYAIPDGVERIEERAFAICDGLTGVTIPESVTSIGKTAFDSCYGLREVRIPAGVTEIGQSAFAGCENMTEIRVAEGNSVYASVDGVLYQADMTVLLQCPAGKTGGMAIPSGVTVIGEFAFDFCTKLTSVTIPDEVTDIGDYAFIRCRGLERAVIGAGVTHIGAFVFSGCAGLSEIRFKGSAPEIGTYAFDSVTADVYYPENDPSWTEEVRQSYGGTLTWVAAPAVIASGTCGDNLTWTLDGNGLLIISGEGEMTNWAWNLVAPWFEQRPSIREIRIESGVTSVGSYAFYGCSNLEKLTLAEGITDIGEFGFYECGALPGLQLPESLCSIGPYAFSACDSLSSVTIPKNVTNIVRGAFTGDDSLTEILVEEGNPAYASRDGVLFNASGTALVLYPCGRTGAYAIPDGVERIEERAFAICDGLTGVTIPESVTSIGKTAFDSCYGLREVRIPAGVTEIGQSAFASCANMTRILVAEGNPAYTSVDGVLYPADMTVLLQCPAGKTGEMAVPSSVKTIGEFAFVYCEQLTSLIIPDGVTDIGNYAFSGCRGLERATLGAGITHIGALAFSGCNGLREIRFKGSAPEIGTYAFDSVTADVYYPENDPSWTEEVRQSYRGTLTWLTWDPSPVSGDVNGDGTVDNADLIRMRKALCGTPATEIEEANSDVNGDGTVDLLDLVRMLKYFAGMDVTLE